MYTEKNKGFTIITNFGCDQNCTYCISKHHPILKNAITDINKIDWNYLEECVKNSSAPTVNLSGGGDPFYRYWEHKDFYRRVYDIAHKYNKQIDVHTRVIPDKEILSMLRKIGLTVEYWNETAIDNLRERFKEITSLTSIRVIQVLDSRMNEDDIRNYIRKMKDIGVEQITFRQMFGNRAAYNHFNELKDMDWGDGVMFLKDGEYHNYYFTTNNKLYPYFFGESEQYRLDWMKKYEEIEQSCN